MTHRDAMHLAVGHAFGASDCGGELAPISSTPDPDRGQVARTVHVHECARCGARFSLATGEGGSVTLLNCYVPPPITSVRHLAWSLDAKRRGK
jgi:hypothetical protein